MLSVRAMVKLGDLVLFEGDTCKATCNSKLLAVSMIREKLCVLMIREDQFSIAREESQSDLHLWHCRLAH